MSGTITDRIDGISTSVAVKAPVKVCATGNITLYGEQTIDGVAVVSGDRVFLPLQTDATARGIYDVSTSAWKRSGDFDGARDIVQGTIIPVNLGAVNGDKLFKVSTANPIVIGTTALVFEEIALLDQDYLDLVTSAVSAAEDAAIDAAASADSAAATLAGALPKTGGSMTGSLNFASAGVIASAPTTDIWNVSGNIAEISGTATITSFGTAPQGGAWRLCRFGSSATITNNANIRVQGGSSILASAGDYIMVDAYSPTVADVQYFKFNGTAVKGAAVGTSRTSAYTAVQSDDLIPCNATSGAFTVALFTAVGNSGKTIEIVKTDSTFNVVTIDGAGTETINGALTKKLSTQWEKLILVSDGTNWLIKERYINSEWVTFTPTFTHDSGALSNNTNTGRWRRVGDSIEMNTNVLFSAASSAFSNLYLALPTGLTVDSAKLASSSTFSKSCGIVACLDSGGLPYDGSARLNAGASSMLLQVSNAAATYLSGTGISNTIPITFALNDTINVSTTLIPVTNWEC